MEFFILRKTYYKFSITCFFVFRADGKFHIYSTSLYPFKHNRLVFDYNVPIFRFILSDCIQFPYRFLIQSSILHR